jgi:hypothetical protein
MNHEEAVTPSHNQTLQIRPISYKEQPPKIEEGEYNPNTDEYLKK